MTTYQGHYSFGEITFSFDDDSLGRNFCRTYNLSEISVPDNSSTYRIRTNRKGYAIHQLRGRPEFRQTTSGVIGYLDSQLDKLIRSNIKEGFASAHASSSALFGKAIVCMGLSNSGKTTLALALSKIGDGFIGDEYASIDLSYGLLTHERYPVQIKPGSKTLLRISEDGLPVLNESGYATEAYSPEQLGVISLSGFFNIRALLFPTHSENRTASEIERVSVNCLPELIMPSLIGGENRSALFSDTLRFIASNHVPCYSIKYSNCHDAALAIKKTFSPYYDSEEQ